MTRRSRYSQHLLLICLGLIQSFSIQAEEPDGKQLYEQNCAACHGREFQGSGLGPALSPKTYVYGGQEWDVYRIAKTA